MKYEDLPDSLKELVGSLKHGSSTIECDVKDAIHEAESVSEFISIATGWLKDLKDDCEDVIEKLSSHISEKSPGECSQERISSSK